MISRDALLAELARVLAAAWPDEADALLARVERSFAAGTDAIPLFDGLARAVREAFGDDANRLLAPLELALLEERRGREGDDVGVLCVVGREPIGWNAWRSGAALVDGTPGEGEGAVFIAVRKGEDDPFLLLARSDEWHFRAGAARAPATGHLFAGHTDRVEVFSLDPSAPKRIAEHDVVLFWYFIEHESVVLAVAETDVFAFAPTGALLWNEFIDPPHVVTRDGELLLIEEQLLGTARRIRISDGTAVELLGR